jgi:hypothetical protein
VYDGLGRNINVVATRKGNEIELSIHELANGLYYILYRSGEKMMSNSFVKE